MTSDPHPPIMTTNSVSSSSSIASSNSTTVSPSTVVSTTSPINKRKYDQEPETEIILDINNSNGPGHEHERIHDELNMENIRPRTRPRINSIN